MSPFVNQQFSLQVVEGGRAVQFVEQFTSGEDVTPAGLCSPTIRHHAHSTPVDVLLHLAIRASVASLLYADGHVAHDTPRAV